MAISGSVMFALEGSLLGQSAACGVVLPRVHFMKPLGFILSKKTTSYGMKIIRAW